MRLPFLPALLVCASAMPTLTAAVPAVAEPTAEEAQILLLMNRFRADPVGEADRLLAQRGQNWAPGDVDWAMFEREVKALSPAPPLVFDLHAVAAAREHSRYMIDHGLTHVEEPGKTHFVAKSFGERMKQAGFTGSPGGENCFRDARSPANSHFGFVVDFGKGGPGGMQPGRGHRTNMIASRFNVVGPGAVAHSDRLSVTHNLGRVQGRFAGGVIYLDRNGNGAYDVDEGRGGVTVRSADGAHQVTTWACGAYTLPIAAETAGLVAEWNGLRFAEAIEPGEANVSFHWVIPAQADLELADELIAAARAASERKARAAAVALLLRSADLGLDPERRAAIDALTAPVAAELDAARGAVLGAISGGDGKALKEALRDGSKAFRGTMAADWFDQAELLGRASAGVVGLEAAAAAGPVPVDTLTVLRDGLVAARDAATFDDIKAGFEALLARTAAAGRT